MRRYEHNRHHAQDNEQGKKTGCVERALGWAFGQGLVANTVRAWDKLRVQERITSANRTLRIDGTNGAVLATPLTLFLMKFIFKNRFVNSPSKLFLPWF